MSNFESIPTYFFLRFVYYFQYFIDIREYYINITFPERVIVENIIPRNVIINRGAGEG